MPIELYKCAIKTRINIENTNTRMTTNNMLYKCSGPTDLLNFDDKINE